MEVILKGDRWRSRFVPSHVQDRLIPPSQSSLVDSIVRAESNEKLMLAIETVPSKWVWERTDSILWIPALDRIGDLMTEKLHRKEFIDLRLILDRLQVLLVEPLAECSFNKWDPIILLVNSGVDMMISSTDSVDKINACLECMYLAVRLLKRHPLLSIPRKITKQSIIATGLSISLFVIDINPGTKSWHSVKETKPEIEAVKRSIRESLCPGLEDDASIRDLLGIGHDSLDQLVENKSFPMRSAFNHVLRGGGNLEWLLAIRIASLDLLVTHKPKELKDYMDKYPNILSELTSLTDKGNECSETTLQTILEFMTCVVRDSGTYGESVSKMLEGRIYSLFNRVLSHEFQIESDKLFFAMVGLVAARSGSLTAWGLGGASSQDSSSLWLESAVRFFRNEKSSCHRKIGICRLIGSLIDSPAAASNAGQAFRDVGGFQTANTQLSLDIEYLINRDGDLTDMNQYAEFHTRSVLARSTLRMVEVCFAMNHGAQLDAIDFKQSLAPTMMKIFRNPHKVSIGTVAICGSVLGFLVGHDPVSTIDLIKIGMIDSVSEICKDEKVLSSPETISALCQCVAALSLHADGLKELEKVGNPLCRDIIPAFGKPWIGSFWICNNQLNDIGDMTPASLIGGTVEEMIRNNSDSRMNILSAVVTAVICLAKSLEPGNRMNSDLFHSICRLIEFLCNSSPDNTAKLMELGVLNEVVSLALKKDILPPCFTNVIPLHGICRLFKMIAHQCFQLHTSNQPSVEVIYDWPKSISLEISQINRSDLSSIHLLLHICASAIKDVGPSTNPIVVGHFNKILESIVDDGGLNDSTCCVMNIINTVAPYMELDPETKANEEKELRRRLKDDGFHGESFLQVYGENNEFVERETARGLWMVLRGYFCQVARVINYPSVPRQYRRGPAPVQGSVSSQARVASWYLGIASNIFLDYAIKEDSLIAISEAIDALCRIHVEDKHHMTRSLCIDTFYKQGGVSRLMKLLRICCKDAKFFAEPLQAILWWIERTTSLKRMHNSQLTFMLQKQGDVEERAGLIKFDAVSLVSSIQYLFASSFAPLWRNDECVVKISSKASASLLKAFTHVLEPNEKVLRDRPSGGSPPSPPLPAHEGNGPVGGFITSLLQRASDVISARSRSNSIWRRGSDDSTSSGVPLGILAAFNQTASVSGDSALTDAISRSNHEELIEYVSSQQVMGMASNIASDFMERTLVIGSSEFTAPVSAQTHIADVCVRLSHNKILKLGPDDGEIASQIETASLIETEPLLRPRDRTGTVALTADETGELVIDDDEEMLIDTQTRIDGERRRSNNDLASVETDGNESNSQQILPVVDFSIYNTRHIASICVKYSVMDDVSDSKRGIALTILACILHARFELVADLVIDLIPSVERLLRLAMKHDKPPSWLTSALICVNKLVQKKTVPFPVSLGEVVAECLHAWQPSEFDSHAREAILRLLNDAPSHYNLEDFLKIVPFEGIENLCRPFLGLGKPDSVDPRITAWKLEHEVVTALQRAGDKGCRLSELMDGTEANVESSAGLRKILEGIVSWRSLRSRAYSQDDEVKRQKISSLQDTDSIVVTLLPEARWTRSLLSKPTDVPSEVTSRLELLLSKLTSIQGAESIMYYIHLLCRDSRESLFIPQDADFKILAVNNLDSRMVQACLSWITDVIDKGNEDIGTINKRLDQLLGILFTYGNRETVQNEVTDFLKLEGDEPTLGRCVVLRKVCSPGMRRLDDVKAWCVKQLSLAKHPDVMEGLVECLEVLTRPATESDSRVFAEASTQFPRFYSARRRSSSNGGDGLVIEPSDFMAQPPTSSQYFTSPSDGSVSLNSWSFETSTFSPDHSLISRSHTGSSAASSPQVNSRRQHPPTPPPIDRGQSPGVSDMLEWLLNNAPMDQADEILMDVVVDEEGGIELMDEEDDDNQSSDFPIDDEEPSRVTQTSSPIVVTNTEEEPVVPVEEPLPPSGIVAIESAAQRYGVSESEFLRRTGIDPSVLRDLPEEMHEEIIREYSIQLGPPSDVVDNASFLSTLLQPELRDEIMLSANAEFLQSLPPDLHAEAILLRERATTRRRRAPRMNQTRAGPESAAAIRSITDLFRNVNDSRVTVRQIGTNMAAVNVSAPTDSVEMTQLIEMLMNGAGAQQGASNRRMMVQSSNDLRRIFNRRNLGTVPDAAAFMVLDTSFPPLESNGQSNLPVTPRISTDAIKKACEMYSCRSEPILPITSVETILKLLNNPNLTSSVAVENLLFNLSLQPSLRERILDQIIQDLGSVDSMEIGCATQLPVSTIRNRLGASLISVLKLLVNHIPLVTNWFTTPGGIEGLKQLISLSIERNQLLDILEVLFKSATFKKIEIDQKSIGILLQVVFKQEKLDIVTSLLASEAHSQIVKRLLKELIRSTSLILTEKFTESWFEGYDIKLLRFIKAYKTVDDGSISDDLQTLWSTLDSILSDSAASNSKKYLSLIKAFIMAHDSPPVLSVTTPSALRSVSGSPDKIESQLSDFAERHRKILNGLIREKPELLNKSFSPLVIHCPWTLDFDNKRNYFRSKLRKDEVSAAQTNPIRLSVRRSEVFMDSYYQLRLRSADEMRGKLSVQFTGEEGVDAGGLVREWFGILAREIFNPNYALFRTAGGKASTFHPNPTSFVNPDHLSFFQFCGRVMGKALYDDQRLDAYFTRSFYKHMLGSPVTWMDFEVEDPEYYKQLQWILNTDLTSPDAIGVVEDMTFTIDVDEFGHVRTVDLVPNGSNIPLTEANKKEYVRLVCEYKMTTSITPQVEAFLKGFHELIPAELIGSLFDDKELELLVSGLPTIDLEDLKANTDYVNYTASAPQIQWLWHVLENDFSQEQLAWFLQFVTGSTQVPLEGFKALVGMRGPQKFSIHRAYGSDRLPTAHTCFNQLDLPEYKDEDTLREKLIKAVTEAHEGFGFI